MLKHALAYARKGLYVFPLRETDKRPQIKEWQNSATTDQDQIRQWWGNWPKANIGIVCGKSGLTVVDLDVKDGLDGIDAWDALCVEHGINDNTRTAKTPSGGLHVYYRSNGHDLHNTAGVLAPGIDTRSNGGYVVAPPSVLPTGSYTWESETPTIEIPNKIVDLLQTKKHKRFMLPDQIEKGNRNPTLFSYACQLRAKGHDHASILAELKMANDRCNPPLEISELENITESACKYEQGTTRYPKSAEYIQVLTGLGYSFRLNECTDRLEVNGQPIADITEKTINAQLRDLGYPRVNVARDAYWAHAGKNSYHPVREYLDGLRWNGQDHISALSCYFDDSLDAFPVFLKRWLIGAIAKAYTGAQNRMLVLDGKQDIGKSHFAAWLLPESLDKSYYLAGPIQPDNKDDKIRLMSVWLWEVAELGSTTRKADREALKAFLSYEQVTVRVPYGHYDLVKPALASFIGTVNNETGILSDPTGNRRFMISHITNIDWRYSQDIDANQVWAQAKALYDSGETWRLIGNEKELANQINETYQVENILEAFFCDAFEITDDPRDFLTTQEALSALYAVGWTGNGNQRNDSRELGKTATKLGIKRDRRLVNKGQKRGLVGIKKL